MKKIVYGMGLIALLSVGIGQAMTQEQLFDEKLIRPLVDIILKDTEDKLATLARQRASLQAKELGRRSKRMLDDIDRRNAFLYIRKQSPILYLSQALKEVGIASPDDLLNALRTDDIELHRNTYKIMSDKIKNASDDEFVRARQTNVTPYAFDDSGLKALLSAEATQLSLNLFHNNKEDEGFNLAFYKYMKEVLRGHEAGWDERQGSSVGPFFSPLEQTYAPSWSNLTNWLSNQWQKMKMYGNQFKQAWQQGARYSMTPAGEYALRRYELGREEPRPLRADYGIWQERVQPYMQRAYQRLEPTVERMQRQVETMKPQLGKDTYSDYFSKIRGGYYGLD